MTLQQAGADIIVGSHAHVLLAGGRLANAFVDYGLGNFFFYADRSGDRAETGILKVTATGRRIDGYEFLPAHDPGGQARLADRRRRPRRHRRLERPARSCTNLTP